MIIAHDFIDMYGNIIVIVKNIRTGHWDSSSSDSNVELFDDAAPNESDDAEGVRE